MIFIPIYLTRTLIHIKGIFLNIFYERGMKICIISMCKNKQNEHVYVRR